MSDYYEDVGAYFDEDAALFDERYWANPILQRIRQAFREEVRRVPFRRALEVGCGTGLDLAHFARVFPERHFVGVDVSARMVALAQQRLEATGLANARVEVAGADEAPEVASGQPFDLCYVFFGALNTVEDLGRAAERLYDALAPGATLVLTFVNRWYLAEMAIGLVRGRWRQAFSRLGERWGGYSPHRELASRCYGPGTVLRAFGRQGRCLRTRGFSITYPAWYRSHWLTRLGRVGPRLWVLDERLSRTPLWALGEYALYVFRKDAG
jgi:SAM-dependent methyltransferase